MTDHDEHQGLEEQLSELLQELRVALPGVQILLAFLFVVPFNTGFAQLDQSDRDVLFVAVTCAAFATVLMIAPSAHHRFAWPLGPRGLRLLVRIATLETRVGMILMGIAIAASFFVVSKVILGSTAGLPAVLGVGVAIAGLWLGLPLLTRRSDHPDRR